MDRFKKILFWQPTNTILPFFLKNKINKFLLVFINYSIWVILAYFSFILIKSDNNIFLRLLFAISIGEIIERLFKVKIYRPRPIIKKKFKIPSGLIKNIYLTGSFPSGHTLKSTIFFFFILQYQVISPLVYLIIITPFLFFRIIVGLHYPFDIIGGILIGFILWLISIPILSPPFLNNFVSFFIKLI